MNENLFNKVYNPDVLSCLANLSNDEVFTPPEIVNQMLDMLPQELFKNPDTTFLDPACKTGVFLREIAKRLIKGLEPQFPDLQERIDHIFHKQLFGIAITELTSLLSRRGIYCSKYPNSDFSVTKFDNAQGNIRFKRIEHTWDTKEIQYDSNGKMISYDKTRGKKAAINAILSQMKNHATDGLNYNGKCFISHSNYLEGALLLKEKIEEEFKEISEVKIYDIGNIIASHTGPGTVALFYMGDERK
jgi:type I restriction-modification system DNA methylase subunit